MRGKNSLIHVPYNKGVDQSVDDRLTEPGTFTRVQNMRTQKTLLAKRAGVTAVDCTNVESQGPPILGDGTTTVVEKPSFLTVVGEAPVLGTTSGLMWAVDDATGTRFSVSRGRFSTAKPSSSKAGINYTTISTVFPTSAINDEGYRASAWTTTQPDVASVNVVVTITNPEGIPIGTLKVELLTDVDRVKLFTQGNKFFCVYNDTRYIYLTRLLPVGNDVTVQAQVQLLDYGVPSGPMFFDCVDIGVVSGTRYWALSYGMGGSSGFFVALVADGTITGNTPYAAGADPVVPATSLYWDDVYGRLWVGLTDFRNPFGATDYHSRVWVLDGTLTQILAPVTIKQGTSVLGPPLMGRYRDLNGTIATKSKVFFAIRSNNPTSSEGLSTYVGTYDESGTGGVGGQIGGVMPITKPDNYNRIWSISANDWGASTVNAAAVYRFSLLRYADNASVGGGGTRAPVIELATAEYPAGTIFNNLIAAGDQFGAIAVGSSECSVTLPINLGPVLDMREFVYQTVEQDPHVYTSVGGPSMVTGGQPTEHFGSPHGINLFSTGANSALILPGAVECGWLYAPRIISATAVSGSPGIGAGTRSYKAVFEWVDTYGRRHQSPDSLPVSLTIVAGKNVTLVISTVQVGQRVDQGDETLTPVVSLYSTVDQGTNYLYARTVNLNAGNDLTVSATLSSTDLTLEANGSFIYTDGGVLPNVLAPSGAFQAFSDDRLWIAGSWDPTAIIASKTIVPTEPIQFTGSDAFQVNTPGPCTGLEVLDGSVLAFTKSGVYQIAGDGPNDQGIGSFPSPRIISKSVGCVKPRSILKTDLGILFLSKTGFWLLPRGLGNPQFVGDKVRDDTTITYPTCLGATVVHDSSNYLARFLMSATTGGTPIVLTMDLRSGAWYRDYYQRTGGDMDFLEIGTWPTGGVFMRETLNSGTVTSPILIEDGSAVDDAGTNIVQRADTAWIYPFGAGGWGNIRKILIAAEVISTASYLVLQVQTDQNTADSHAWSLSGVTAGTIVYRELDCTITKCTCFRVFVGDDASLATSPPTVTATQGVKLVSLTVEADVDGGIRLLDLSAERV